MTDIPAEVPDDDQVFVVLEAGEDFEGAMVISLVGVYTDKEDIPKEGPLHRSVVSAFVDTDMDSVPVIRFLPTKEVAERLREVEVERQVVTEKRKRGDYNP